MKPLPVITKDEEIRQLKRMNAKLKKILADALDEMVSLSDSKKATKETNKTSANPPKSERQILAEDQHELLNHGLRTLASWCASRAMLDHDIETTLTMLEKKAAELRRKCMKSGWAAINEHSQHND
jgi:hypothetical protein